MSAGTRDPVARAFNGLHTNNPLNQLDDSNCKFLWALLMMYAEVTSPRKTRNAVLDQLERVSKTVSKVVADATKVAARLESEIFLGPFVEPLRPFLVGFEDLPMRLVQFSNRLEMVLDSTGKCGHKRQNLAAQFLIQASEFVRLKTGQHNDEHVADLFQQIGKRSVKLDLSGDAIRKKRKYLKDQNPIALASAVRRARRHCQDSKPSTAS
ncbi:hypothetical protein SBA5_110007 [Candidatus Sulfotelmatomonas gaucii]|uniref:Uncharacterized protein n=1 Tax=Candidatus Sulfuritelmatomonas gaucii TaxID=2043161 RepID=A0A2N9L2T8_9BACT|nr:hypothetical protein SBA5_110007 [Candidatus Sulfotelmatomonas gaucii]